MRERSDVLMVTEIFSLCMVKPRTINELTQKIYKNMYAKNVVRVFQCVEIMMTHGVIVPQFKNRTLTFRVEVEKKEE